MANLIMTPAQLRRAGLTALIRELGPIGMVRFLQQLETGSGDYSAERHLLPGPDCVTALAEQIRREGASGTD
jgi:hypothetical protein